MDKTRDQMLAALQSISTTPTDSSSTPLLSRQSNDYQTSDIEPVTHTSDARSTSTATASTAAAKPAKKIGKKGKLAVA
jgi:hypothetical protein